MSNAPLELLLTVVPAGAAAPPAHLWLVQCIDERMGVHAAAARCKAGRSEAGLLLAGAAAPSTCASTCGGVDERMRVRAAADGCARGCCCPVCALLPAPAKARVVGTEF